MNRPTHLRSLSALTLFAGAALVALAPPLGGCAAIAVATAPAKVAARDESPATAQADAAFWSTFHAGRYDDIGKVMEPLEAAYLAHPEDPRIAAHIAFLHVWRLGERVRDDRPRATVTDDATLARRYFEEAVQLAPHDPRFRGFLASLTMAEGAIHHEEKETRRGFFAMNEAVDAWPEFNLFTRGYVLSPQPAGSDRFASALEDQWKNLDVCADARVDRATADFAPYMKLETTVGWKRACWDSWIAPHNFEGFFLNMGDMAVKAGDVEVGKHLYAQAKLAKQYASWPFKDVLERRIAQAAENVALFRAPKEGEKERRIMFESSFGCMGCHQE